MILMPTINDVSHRPRKRTRKLKSNEIVIPSPRLPRQIEERYGRIVRESVKVTKKMVMSRYTETGLKQFEQSLSDLYESVPEFDLAKIAANDMVYKVNASHAKQFYKAAEKAVGFNFRRYINEQGLKDIIETSIDENVKMITDLENTSQRRIAGLISKALIEETGKTLHLQTEIIKALSIDENQARFIARDQTQRVFNGLNKFRQTKAGIKKYQWVTSKDQSVRATHKSNNMKIFLWATPPAITGHPGHDYNCRCSASPVIEIDTQYI